MMCEGPSGRMSGERNVGEGVRWIVGGKKRAGTTRYQNRNLTSTKRACFVEVRFRFWHLVVPARFSSAHDPSHSLSDVSSPDVRPDAPSHIKVAAKLLRPGSEGRAAPHHPSHRSVHSEKRPWLNKKPLRGGGGHAKRSRVIVRSHELLFWPPRLSVWVLHLRAFRSFERDEFVAASLRKGLCRCLWRC